MKPIIYLEITKNGKEIKELLLKNHYKLFHFINGKLEVVDGELPHTSILAKPLT
jgi:hypothetical protein